MPALSATGPTSASAASASRLYDRDIDDDLIDVAFSWGWWWSDFFADVADGKIDLEAFGGRVHTIKPAQLRA
jgi:hypothetical protein